MIDEYTDVHESDETNSDSEDVVESNNDNDDMFQKPKGNTVVHPDCLQSLLDNSAVCKECYSSLRVVEKIGTKQRLAAK